MFNLGTSVVSKISALSKVTLFFFGLVFLVGCSEVQFTEMAGVSTNATDSAGPTTSPPPPDTPDGSPSIKTLVLFQNDSASRLVNRNGGSTKINGVDRPYSLDIYQNPLNPEENVYRRPTKSQSSHL